MFLEDCANSSPAPKIPSSDSMAVRMLFFSSRPGGVDSRQSYVFRNRGELCINLSLVFSDREMLNLYLFDDAEDLFRLLLR